MIKKPTKHCACGTYQHTVLLPIDGRVRDVDFCISDIVAALNAANIVTMASCCGHGKQNGSVLLKDGRELVVSSKNGITE